MAEQKKNQIVLVEGKLTKIIHQEGEGESPVKGQEIYALYRGTLQDGTEFDSNDNRDQPFNFTLGQGRVIKGWDQGFASMKKGQKATLICSPEYAYGARGSPPKIPPNATLNFDVELLDFKDKKKQKWQLTAQQKLQESGKLKSSGNQHFKKSNYRDAISDYKQGIQYLQSQDTPTAKDLLKVLRLNISQAYIKNKQYSNCIDNCKKVLVDQPSNTKALYRKGVAYIGNQQFQLAKKDFLELLKIQPTNAEAQKQLSTVNLKIKQFQQKQKKIFTGMFSKSLYDDKKPQPPKQNKPVEIDSSQQDQIKMKDQKQQQQGNNKQDNNKQDNQNQKQKIEEQKIQEK